MTDQLTNQLIRELGVRASDMRADPWLGQAVVEQARSSRRRFRVTAAASAALVVGATIAGGALLRDAKDTGAARPTAQLTHPTKSSHSPEPSIGPVSSWPGRAAPTLIGTGHPDPHPLAAMDGTAYAVDGVIHFEGHAVAMPQHAVIQRLTQFSAGVLVEFAQTATSTGAAGRGLAILDRSGHLRALPGAISSYAFNVRMNLVAALTPVDQGAAVSYYVLPSGYRLGRSDPLAGGLAITAVSAGHVLLTDASGFHNYLWEPGQRQPVLDDVPAPTDVPAPEWKPALADARVTEIFGDGQAAVILADGKHLTIINSRTGRTTLASTALPTTREATQAVWTGPGQVLVTMRATDPGNTDVTTCTVAAKGCSTPTHVTGQVLVPVSYPPPATPRG